jgi:hypothetical protein
MSYSSNLICFSALRITVTVSDGEFDPSAVTLNANLSTQTIWDSLTDSSSHQQEDFVTEWVFSNHTSPCSTNFSIWLSFTLLAKEGVVASSPLVFDAFVSTEFTTTQWGVITGGGPVQATFYQAIGNSEGVVDASTSFLECESAMVYVSSPHTCYLRLRGSTNHPAIFKSVSEKNVVVNLMTDFNITVENQNGLKLKYEVVEVGNGWSIRFTPPDGTTRILLHAKYLGKKIGDVDGGDVVLYVYEYCGVASSSNVHVSVVPSIECPPNSGIGLGNLWDGCSIEVDLKYQTSGTCFEYLEVTISLSSIFYNISSMSLGPNATQGIANVYNGSKLLEGGVHKLSLPAFSTLDSSSTVFQLLVSLIPNQQDAPSHSAVNFSANITAFSFTVSDNVVISTIKTVSVDINHPRLAIPSIVDPENSTITCESSKVAAESVALCCLTLFSSTGGIARYKSLNPNVFLTAEDINIKASSNVSVSGLVVNRNEWKFYLSIPLIMGSVQIESLLRVGDVWKDVGGEPKNAISLRVFASCNQTVSSQYGGHLYMEWEMICNNLIYPLSDVVATGCVLIGNTVYWTKFVCSETLDISILSPDGVLRLQNNFLGNTTETLAAIFERPDLGSTGAITAAFPHHNLSSTYFPKVNMSFELAVDTALDDKFELTVQAYEIGYSGSVSLNTSMVSLRVVREGTGVVNASHSSIVCGKHGHPVTAGEKYQCYVFLRDLYYGSACCISIYPYRNVSMTDFNMTALDSQGGLMAVEWLNITDNIVHFQILTSPVAGPISVYGYFNGDRISGDSLVTDVIVYANCSTEVCCSQQGIIMKHTTKQCGESGIVASSQFLPLCYVNLSVSYALSYQCFDNIFVSLSFNASVFHVSNLLMGSGTTQGFPRPVLIDLKDNEISWTFSSYNLVVSNSPVLEVIIPMLVKEKAEIGDVTVSIQFQEVDYNNVSRSVSNTDQFDVSVVGKTVKFYFGAVSVYSRQPTGGLSCNIHDKAIIFQNPEQRSNGLWISPSTITANNITEEQFGCGVKDVAGLDLVTFTAVLINTGSDSLYDIEIEIKYDSSAFILPDTEVTVSYGNSDAAILYAKHSATAGCFLVSIDKLPGNNGSTYGHNVLLVGLTLQVDLAAVASVNTVTCRVKSFLTSKHLLINEAEFIADQLVDHVDTQMADLLININFGSIHFNASRQSGHSVSPTALTLSPLSCIQLSMSLTVPPLRVGPLRIDFPFYLDESSINNSQVIMVATDAYIELIGLVNSSISNAISFPGAVYDIGSVYTIISEYDKGNLTLSVNFLLPKSESKNAHGNSASLTARVSYGLHTRYAVLVTIPVIIGEPSLEMSVDILPTPPFYIQGEETVMMRIVINPTHGYQSTAHLTSLWLGLSKNVTVQDVSCKAVSLDGCNSIWGPSVHNDEFSVNELGVTVFRGLDVIEGSSLELNVSFILDDTIRPKTSLSFIAVLTYNSTSSSCGGFSPKSYSRRASYYGSSTLTPYLVNVTFMNSSNEYTSAWKLAFLEYFTVDLSVYMPCVTTDLHVFFELPFFGDGVYKNNHLSVSVVSVSIVHLGSGIQSKDLSCDATSNPVTSYCHNNNSDNFANVTYAGLGYQYGITNAVEFVLRDVKRTGCGSGLHEFGHGLITFRIIGHVGGEAKHHSMVGLLGNLTVQLTYLSSRFISNGYEDYYLTTGIEIFPLFAAEPELNITFAINGSKSAEADAGDIVCYRLFIQQPMNKTKQPYYLPTFDLRLQLTLSPHIHVFNWTDIVANVSGVTMELLLGNDTIHFNMSKFSRNDSFFMKYCGVVIQETPPGIPLRNELEVVYYNEPGQEDGQKYEQLEETTANVSPVTLDVHICNSSVEDTETIHVHLGHEHAVIEEEFCFMYTLRVPESETDLKLKVLLPTGSSSNVLVTVLDAWVDFVGFDIVNSTIQAGDHLGNTTDDSNRTENIYTESKYLIWDFGRITNVINNNKTVDDTIIVTYLVRVLDDEDTVRHKKLYFDPVVYTDQKVLSAKSKHYVLVLEPLLEVTSTAYLNNTVDGGDIVNYTFLLQHNEDSNAIGYRLAWQIAVPRVYLILYEWTVSVSAKLGNDSGTPQISVINDTSKESWFGSGYDVIVYNIERLEGEEWVRVTFLANTTQAVSAGQQLSVPATVQYFSLPHHVELLLGRRHTFSHSQIVTMQGSKLSLSVSGSSIAVTKSPAVAVSESVTYSINVTVPETVMNLTVVVAMPFINNAALMNLTEATIARVGSNIANSLLREGDSLLTSTEIYFIGTPENATLFFHFGEITNQFDNIDSFDDQLYLEFKATVLDGEISQNQHITVVASLLYEPSVFDTASLLLVEPSLVAYINSTAGPWLSGYIVQYSIVLTQAVFSLGPAFDISTIIDFGRGQIFNISLVKAKLIGEECESTDVEFDSNLISGNAIKFYVSELLKGCSYVIDITVEIDVTVLPAELITASVYVVEYYSGTSYSGRRYIGLDPMNSSTPIASPSFSDTNRLTRSSVDVSYGWSFSFSYTVLFQHGTTPNSVVTFTLPFVNGSPAYDFYNASLEFQGNQIELLRPPQISGNSSLIVVDLGNVINYPDNIIDDQDTLQLLVTVYVRDQDSEVVPGFSTSVSYQDALGNLQTVSSPAWDSINIVIPRLKSKLAVAPLIAKGDVTYTVMLTHEDDKGAAGLSYDVSVVFVIDGRLDLPSDAVTANQEPNQVTVTRTDNSGVVTVFYDSLNASVFASNNISVRAELTDRTPAGIELYSWANVTWDTSPEDSPSPYKGRVLSVPIQSFPVHWTRVMNVSSCYLSNENSKRADSATIGERVTMAFEVYLRDEGVKDMSITVKVVERNRPGLSSNLLVTVPQEGASLSQESPSSSQLAIVDDGVAVTVFGVDPSSLKESLLQVNISVIISGYDLLYAGDSLRFESVISYDGMIAQCSEALNITEPMLSAVISVDTPLFDGGDTLIFQMRLLHSNGSSADATNISAQVTTSSLQISSELVICDQDTIESATGNKEITFQMDRLTLEIPSVDSQVICSYIGVASANILPNKVVEWTVTVTYYSARVFGRRYITFNTTAAVTRTVTSFTGRVMNKTTSNSPLLTDPAKVATLYGIDGLSVAPNEKFYYFLYLRMPEVTTTLKFFVTVEEANGEDPVLEVSFNVSDIEDGGNFELTSAIGVSKPSANAWILDLGTVRNNPDNDQSNDFVGIPISLNVSNVGLSKTVPLITVATLEEATGKRNLSSSVDLTVVAPDLSFISFISGDPKDAGDLFTYTVTIKHDVNSTGPAQALKLRLFHTTPLFIDEEISGYAVFSSNPNVSQKLSGAVENLVSLGLLEVGNVTVAIHLRLSNSTRPNQRVETNISLQYEDAGIGMYVRGPQTIYFTTAKPSNITETVETGFDVTMTNELMIGEQGTFLSTVTLLEGTANVKLMIRIESQTESPVSIRLTSYRILPVGFMMSRVIPDATVVASVSGEPRVRYIVWNFGKLVNEADNVETINDTLFFEVMQITRYFIV